VSRPIAWVTCCTALAASPARAVAADPAAPPALTDARVEAWLHEPPAAADTATEAEPDAPILPPRRHGWVVEGSAGALGHLGNMRDVSPVAPWFRLQVGYEPFTWLMLLAQGDVALSSTSRANRPPDKRGFALFGFGGGARLSWQAFSAVGFYLQGEAGLASVNQDVLATYGYPDADRLRPFAGATLGIEWFQLSPHYALGLAGGARDYFQTFDRINGDRPPLVWFSDVAIRYAL
jgi:hypothetical protein